MLKEFMSCKICIEIIITCYKNINRIRYGYKQSYFPLTVNLWNSLPNRCFSENYSLYLFKKRCYTYFFVRRGQL